MLSCLSIVITGHGAYGPCQVKRYKPRATLGKPAMFLCNWLEMVSTSTWTMAFRDCRLRESLGTLLCQFAVCFFWATSQLNVRLSEMRVIVNDVLPHLCKILTLIMVKTYLQTGQRRYRIARRPVVTCYNSAKSLETSKCIREHPKTYSFSAGRTSRNGHYNLANAYFSD